MRRVIPVLIASLALAPLSLALAPRALAEDAPDDQSPAAKAYRDAWWAETGGGNLNTAIEGYTKAADAEGPASVKARALYRKAIVLQRIGKTEEAIRTLERLAKDHPGEAALQADARARLAEWTAVDLKTSFAEWYQRYQYSPEFQAKIVDLVLKLGASDGTVIQAASNELLTIGAPAIPALRQHVQSANYQLRYRVVTNLLLLGDVPSLRDLRETGAWQSDPRAWATIAGAGAEVRARLKSEAQEDNPWDRGVLALLEGPVALLTWASTPSASSVAELFVSRALSLRQGDPTATAAIPLLRGLAENGAFAAGLRTAAITQLLGVRGVDMALAERWASGEDPLLRNNGVNVLTNAGGAEAHAALRRVVKLAAAWERGEGRQRVFTALVRGLESAPRGEDLDRLADDLLPLWTSSGIGAPLKPAARAVLARMVDRTPDRRVAQELLSNWRASASLMPSDLEMLAQWARSSVWEEVRVAAAGALIETGPAGQERALTILADEKVPPDVRQLMYQQLLRRVGRELLLSQQASRATVLRASREAELRSGATRQGELSVRMLMGQLTQESRRAVAEAWLSDPVWFPRDLLAGDGWGSDGFMSDEWRRIIGSLTPAWRKSWATWTPAQRDAALEGLPVLFPTRDPELEPFLRAAVRDPANGISPKSREAILRYLDPVELADLRATFDLNKPEGVDAAIGLVLGTPLPGVEWTPELFEALKPGLRPDGDDVAARALYKAFKSDPRVQRPLVEALLAHSVESLQESALDILSARESTEDLPLWLKALTLPSADVRAKAATGLGRIAHPDATKALVAALDDPNSRVRDAAIASLEAIQKVEELKKTWREKVR